MLTPACRAGCCLPAGLSMVGPRRLPRGRRSPCSSWRMRAQLRVQGQTHLRAGRACDAAARAQEFKQRLKDEYLNLGGSADRVRPPARAAAAPAAALRVV